jgi:hypothetical protein
MRFSTFESQSQGMGGGKMRIWISWTCCLGVALVLLGGCAHSDDNEGGGQGLLGFSAKTSKSKSKSKETSTAPKATAEDVNRASKTWWDTSGLKLTDILCYPDPLDPAHFGNVFLMASGSRVVSISLNARSKGSMYEGDQFIVEDLGTARLSLFSTDERVKDQEAADHYRVSVSPSGKDSIITVKDSDELKASLSLSQLRRWRVENARQTLEVGRTNYKVSYQLRDGATLFFTEAVAAAWLDPEAKSEAMVPTYVVPWKQKQADGSWTVIPIRPIGDSGYVLDAEWKVQLAK